MRVIMSEDDGRASPEDEDYSTPHSDYQDDSTDEWTAIDDNGRGPIPPDASKGAAAAGPPSSTPDVPMSRIALNDNKAGMEGLDKAKINQIILEASKGSRYYENELRKEKQVNERVSCMLRRLAGITQAQKTAALSATDKELESLEGSRDLTHIIVHIDMDAFYASVEIQDDPRLKDVPMAVGSTSMLSTSNYLARRYGVRAAMPGFIAKKLCPDLIIVPAHFSKYRASSDLVREVLARYDPQFSPVGLDESYLDLTEFVRQRIERQQPQQNVGEHAMVGSLSRLHWECAEEVVEEMRREIHEKTGLTASAGLAPNMMLAKVASDMNKPNGQYTVTATREGVLDFIHKLPIRKISGIGKVTERLLNALSVTTCGDLHQQRAVLRLLFSQTSSTYFLRISIGLGSTQVHREYDRKSMSTERTFSEINTVPVLQQKCRELCCELERDMSQEQIKGYTVTLKMKKVGFEVKTRAVTLSQPVSSAEQLYSAASELLTAEIRACAPEPLRLRLMGVRISSLVKGESGGVGSKQETLDVFVQPPPPPSVQDSSDIGSTLPSVTCPVCGTKLEDTRDSHVNAHIDECLNQPTITSITSSTADSTHTTIEPTRSPKKIKSVESPTKSSSTTSLVSPAKLRGIGGERGRRVSSGKKACTRKRRSEFESDPVMKRKTLDHFWK